MLKPFFKSISLFSLPETKGSIPICAVHVLTYCHHQGKQSSIRFTLTFPNVKKWSRYRSGVAQRVGRGIALLFHDRGTRRGWVVSSTPRPHFTPEKDPVPILQEAGWAPVLVWTGGKSRPHRDSIPDRPARSQSLYPNVKTLLKTCRASLIDIHIKCMKDVRKSVQILTRNTP